MSGAVCDALVQACSRSGGDDEPICISVLVGGAGNGKSKLASDVVSRISGVYVGDKSEFAKRSYEYLLENGSSLIVINDATIPPDAEIRSPLAKDIGNAISQSKHILVCVNRGVLINETQRREDMAQLRQRHANYLLGSFMRIQMRSSSF